MIQEIVSFTIPGSPIAQKRPRFSRFKNRVIVYDDQKDDKKNLKYFYLKELTKKGIHSAFSENLEVKFQFFTPLQKNFSKKKKLSLEGAFNPQRPDLDNYVKFYLDSMNNIVFKDDNQVVSICCEKRFSDIPRTEINIFILGE